MILLFSIGLSDHNMNNELVFRNTAIGFLVYKYNLSSAQEGSESSSLFSLSLSYLFTKP